MPPCHACPCITEPQPDISCSMRELVDEAGVAAPVADVQGEATAVFSQGFGLSEGLNDDPHLTLDVHTDTEVHLKDIQEINTLLTDPSEEERQCGNYS